MGAHGEAGEGALHDEGGQAALTSGLVGHGDDDEHIGVTGVGDEDLGAVQDVVLALLVQHGHGLDAAGVGARAGLGQAEGAQPLAGAQLGQILLLLSLGAEVIDGVGAQAGMSGEDDAGGAADLAHLLNSHDIAEVGSALAAVLLGEINAHHAQLGHLLDGLGGETLFLVHFLSQRLDLVLSEAAIHLLDEEFFFRQIKIHVIGSS